ncbi:MAG: hypothetical protein NC037_05145 [Bacteroides sp.]|nr:hypothetical protein [Bacillota bacterium]MCM1394095.1 hypothetical protein [[Eubacterium] siraeum]MCM1455892.1 hypothetical protein [Bacteroides sp.]
MSDENIKSKNRGVDDAGIRLAPTPIRNSSYHVMPAIKQEFVITPKIEIEEQESSDEYERRTNTANDFQPKTEDRSKKWKRRKRSKNMIIGVIMLLLTTVMLLPYIFGATGVWLENFPFKFVPRQFGALNNIVEAFKLSAELGWKGDFVKAIWTLNVPSIILMVGFIFLAINFIKAAISILGTYKPIKYTVGASVYLLTVLAVFIASLVGAESIGIAKINFMQDFIHGYKTSELFSLIVFAAGYFLVSLICTLIDSDKYGYLR